MILTNYAIKFRTAVFVLIFVILLAGGNSYLSLPREGSPDITIPFVFVTAIYEGTAPSEIEKLVTIQLEKKFNDLQGVKEISSVSADSVSSFFIEFQSGQDMDLALQRVKNKIDLAKPDLPDDLDEPVVEAINFSTDFPIFTFTLSGNAELPRLKNLADELQDQLESISRVKQAEISGIREREIRVEIDLPRLIAYNVPLGLLMQRIQQENTTVSAGNIEIRGQKFQVRIPGEYDMVSPIRDILITERDGRPIYLRDLATITDTYKDLSSISRLNGEPCVTLSVKKRNGENSVRVIDDVKAVLDRFQLPPDIKLTIVMDESDYIQMMIEELENNIFSGFVLVIAVLLLFMGGRNSLFVAIAIPFSMLLAFIIIRMIGLTLNMIVLFSLVLAVGMLVDNAIVIVENIYRHRTLGLTRKESARRGASEVAWPVITSTMTTLAAFSPLLFWPDIMGQFMGFLPRTLIIVLSSSLFVALIINPAVCSALISAKRKRPGSDHSAPEKHRFVQLYETILHGALHHRLVVLLIGFAFLFLTMLVYGRFGHGQELFPNTDPRNAVIQIAFPQGTSIERTDAALRSFEKILPQFEDIKFYLTNVGSKGGNNMGGGSGTHVGNIHVEFKEHKERTGNTMELIADIRNSIEKIAGAEITVEKQEEGPPLGAPVSIELSGDDFDVLTEYADQIMQTIEPVPGLVDLQDDLEDALPELQFDVDRYRAALLGLDTDTIGMFLRTSIYGLESSKYRADEDEYDITIRLPENQRNTLNLMDEIFIPLNNGATVPLSSVGTMRYTAGKGAISRKDQKRVITIEGNDEGRSVDEILKDVEARISAIDLPRGYAVKYAGDKEEMQKSMAFLAQAFMIALGLILVILVIQFNSVILPLVIAFSVVLSLIGVMWGLLICNMRFSVIMTGLGVISLAGIVVNNAIVLIDCINQRKSDGLDTEQAVVEAGRLRLRPVLLTATTTILGLIPMAIGYSLEIHSFPPRIIAGAESSQWWAPMAIAVIFGLAMATILTLVYVPVMYSLSDSVARFFRTRFAPSDD